MPVFKKYGEEAKVFQDFFPNLLHVCEGKPKNFLFYPYIISKEFDVQWS